MEKNYPAADPYSVIQGDDYRFIWLILLIIGYTDPVKKR